MDISVIVSILVFLLFVITLLFLPVFATSSLLLLFQLLLPHRADLLRVQVRKDEVKDVAVPIHGMAFDIGFDVLDKG